MNTTKYDLTQIYKTSSTFEISWYNLPHQQALKKKKWIITLIDAEKSVWWNLIFTIHIENFQKTSNRGELPYLEKKYLQKPCG